MRELVRDMLGVRMSFHVKPFIDWLDDGSLDWFWAACERCAIPVNGRQNSPDRRAAPRSPSWSHRWSVGFEANTSATSRYNNNIHSAAPSGVRPIGLRSCGGLNK
jgi:hypothetical protein